MLNGSAAGEATFLAIDFQFWGKPAGIKFRILKDPVPQINPTFVNGILENTAGFIEHPAPLCQSQLAHLRGRVESSREHDFAGVDVANPRYDGAVQYETFQLAGLPWA